ncbi:MAG: Transglycosylase associated protein [Acidobacteriaceae bacterium]|nr:Transglycosylase associated protein [Acidobacteriaceae bacterium]
MHLLWWIIVGLFAGWATGKIMRGSGYGPLMDIVVGVAGAVVGGWIMRAVGFQGQGGMLYTILVAIGGAVVLTLLYRLLVGPPGRGKGAGPTPIDEGKGTSNLRKVA